MRFLVFLFLFFCCFSKSYAQVASEITLFNKEDSVGNKYYTDKSDKLLIKFTNIVKYSGLDIKNKNTNNTLRMSPTGSLDLGLEVNHRWLGLGFSMGLPSDKNSDSTKGKTSKFDLQLNIYSKRVVVDALYQRYKGFHISNPDDFSNWDSTSVYPQLPGMENYSLGISAYYIFNYKKFSYKAAYVRNEVQNKSAGSLLIGPFFNRDEASAPNGFVPSSLPNSVKDTFNMSYFSSTSYGLAVGYTYSLVYKKKIFINFSLVPGIGMKNIETKFNGENRALKEGLAARVTYRFAMGYEHQSFILGFTLYGSQGDIQIDNFEFKPGAGMLKLFVAKRFNVIKSKDKSIK